MTREFGKQDLERSSSTIAPFSWAVTAPFLTETKDRWISDFTETDRHAFEVIHTSGAEVSWHSKKVARTGLAEWGDFAQLANRALRHAADNDGGVITVFPQLAAAAASRKRLRRSDTPLVAWFFNTNLDNGIRSRMARLTLPAVDRFVVHSTAEIDAYSRQLRIPSDRFEFVAAQYGGRIMDDPEDENEPFVFATGSGFRDYGTFFEAMRRLDIPAKVVAGPRILAGLSVPPNVEILDVSSDEIKRMMRRARVNVIPMTTEGVTAGLLTIVLTYRHGRSLVVSDRPGIDDYVHHDVDSLVVPQRDPEAMAASIEAMFVDDALRRRLNATAEQWAEANCSDHAAGASLVRVLDTVIDG